MPMLDEGLQGRRCLHSLHRGGAVMDERRVHAKPLLPPWGLILLFSALTGCSSVPLAPPQAVSERPSAGNVSLGTPVETGSIRWVNLTAGPATSPLPGMSELAADDVVAQVLGRNPSLAEMRAAWQAAVARYPQVTSLDDPMFGVTAAPGAFGANTVQGGYRFEASQKLPYCGKLALRGDHALAEASAAGHEVDDLRLQLAEAARAAFYDLYLAERSLEVNAEGLDLLKQFKQNADTRYNTGLAPQQDSLQADVEIGRQTERRLGLEQLRKVALARINTLMHLPPDAALPPAPKEMHLPEPVPEAAALRALALRADPTWRPSPIACAPRKRR